MLSLFKDKNNLYFKIPYADLTKSSKIFQTIFEDELINCFIKESALKETFEIYIKVPRHLYKKQIREIFDIDKLISNNLLEENDNYYYIPKEKLYLSNSILVAALLLLALTITFKWPCSLFKPS